MSPFKVICIDDRNRPDGIPTNKWIQCGHSYTVIEVAKMRVQGGILGFKLQEINIDDCFPYQFFSASRFGIPAGIDNTEAMLEKLLEEAKREAVEEPQLA